jgi:protein SCO1/2
MRRRDRPDAFASTAFLFWLVVTVSWWVLAFAPLPVPPDWLRSARAVCFGSTPDGIPDSWGWMLLTLGPLSLLAFLAAVWGRELLASLRWLAHRASGAVALGLVGGAMLLGLGLVAGRVAAAGDRGGWTPAGGEPMPDTYPRLDREAPPFELVDQSGQPLTLATLAGRPVLVGFAYAHCTTVCPAIVETLRQAEHDLRAEGVEVVLVTLDPWRDTPARLPALAESWRLAEMGGARVASGPVAEVAAMLAAWNVPAVRNEATGEISHPALVYLLDRRGRIAYAFTNPPDEWLVEAVARLGAES